MTQFEKHMCQIMGGTGVLDVIFSTRYFPEAFNHFGRPDVFLQTYYV